MDAARYFELMHTAMSAQRPRLNLLLTVRVQDLGGADAYLELRQDPADGTARVFYSTMGRRDLNFQLFRKGWQLCHNASGEMTSRFPSTADELLDAGDFSAYIRNDILDTGRAAVILRELRRRAGTSYGIPLSAGYRAGAIITVESFVGQGGQWSYSSDHAADDLPLAALLSWLGDHLAGSERRTLQSCPEAVRLAAQWQAELFSVAQPPKTPCRPRQTRTTSPSRREAASHSPDPKNERWQSILAVLATV